VAIEKRIRQSNLAKDQRLRVLKERDALMKVPMIQKCILRLFSPLAENDGDCA